MGRRTQRARAERGRAPSHAFAPALLCAALLGCGSEPVEARAIWVDAFAAEGSRRIHVYDQGERYEFEVLGATDPQERVRLGPRGRGLLVRAQQRRGAWFDLDDGRRLPLLLPQATPGEPVVNFSARGDALWWRDELDESLRVVPLAPGLPLERDADGSMVALAEPGAIEWAYGSVDAPVLLVKPTGTGAMLLRYPDDSRDALGLTREASAPDLQLPDSPREARTCSTQLFDCKSRVGLAPGGERVLVQDAGAWFEFDPHGVRPLELPSALVPEGGINGLSLLWVLDRSRSVWVRAGQLFAWDQATDTVESAALFAAPPYYWFPVEHGRGLILLSVSGPMYRVDARGLEVVTLDSTSCNIASGSDPVVSPSGRWAGWTCLDTDNEVVAASGVVVRASAAGLERHVGVPMSTLAIDDDGDLLLYSIESIFTDQVDGVTSTSRPRSLFTLSNGGVLSRVDELEPAPTPVLLGSSDYATFIQGAALD